MTSGPVPDRTAAMSASEERGLRRLATIALLAARALATKGREYPALADHLSGETQAFLSSRIKLAGARVLDLGSGRGEFGRSLQRSGATVASVDVRPLGAPGQILADAAALPFGPGSFDGAICSNLLEHVPSPGAVVGELARVVRRGGWVYLSWMAWYAPLGGHEYSPWHYLGVRPARIIGRYARLGPGRNVPGEHLFPVHVGPTIRGIERTGAFHIRYAGPRYWPSQTWILRIPGLREVATWNCLLLLERR
jgi:SAM-dependent methyltransferase